MPEPISNMRDPKENKAERVLESKRESKPAGGANKRMRVPAMPKCSLLLKVLALPVLIFLIGGAIPCVVGYRLLMKDAERQGREKAELVWQTFVTTVNKPAPAEAEKAKGDKSALYRYVEMAPKSPARTGNGYETQLLVTFSTDPNLKRLDGQAVRNGVPCYVIAAPVSGPKGLIGANVLYVPVGDAQERALGMFWAVFKLAGILLLDCFLLLVWRIYTAVIVPLRQVEATSRDIRKGNWKARFGVRASSEFGGLSESLQETTLWLRERIANEEKLRALFQQFVPASVAAKALGKNADSILAGMRHPVSVMVINIRNFKLLMEHLPPEQTVTVLNEYFAAVNRVIVANKGVVSKYLGDSVMAIFGMPLGEEEHALEAVSAALGLPRALQDLYVRLEEEHGWELGIGVGISTGEPIVGHFGSSEHMEYSLLGDVVVEAHRLEELTKSVPEEDSILISEETYRRVMSDVHVYDMGEKTTREGKMLHPYVVQGFRSEARSALAA